MSRGIYKKESPLYSIDMKELQHLYNGRSVRTVEIDGKPFFRLSDVGMILDLSNPYRYEFIKKGSRTVTILTDGGPQSISYINEPTLYRLIFKSRKQEAEAFQDWVFETVLPAIRSTGKYQIPKEIREESTEKRKELTDAWKESGINERWQYGTLTKEEYERLGFPDGLRKPSMTRDQLMVLMALETFERVNLHFNRKRGFLECRDSLRSTARIITKEIQKNGQSNTPRR